jgi:hypothetical protein
MSDLTINGYLQELVAEVLASAEAEGTTTPQVFTRRALDDLEQAGVTENTFAAHHKAYGIQVSGYGSNESLDTLDLFVTADFSMAGEVEKIGKTEVETLFRRLLSFVQRCGDGLRQQIDESDDVYDMCTGVERKLKAVSRLRLFLLTNREATVTSLPPSTLGDQPVTYEIWDLTRFHRMATSGTLTEPIAIEFSEPLPCLATPPAPGQEFSVFLAILPGTELARWYGDYGTRLLELNVRSFLQTKGAINRGIRETLLSDPHRFLAYNNGITATASEVELVTLPGWGLAIRRIHDLQIVNGGQTTASIHYAHVKDKADVSAVFVQMKLTEVKTERLDEIVPEISRYSNTQNKVTLVDFSSNHPLHVSVEKVTRSLWAPASDGSGQETRWFYERARGQYADALARERTPARQKAFKVIHPLSQKFTKSDLAKFEHSWDMLPHIVSRGAEKNFREFMIRIADKAPAVDIDYCERLIAKAVLFRGTERIITAQGIQGFRANIVTYTIARLAHDTGQRLDLDRIWREQKLTLALSNAIDELGRLVRAVIASPVRTANVTEWAKHPECWNRVLSIAWDVPGPLRAELVDPSAIVARGRHAAQTRSETAAKLIVTIATIPAEVWFSVERWAKETHNLEPWQRRFARDIGNSISSGQAISYKQAVDAEQLMIAATQLGFRTG